MEIVAYSKFQKENLDELLCIIKKYSKDINPDGYYTPKIKGEGRKSFSINFSDLGIVINKYSAKREIIRFNDSDKAVEFANEYLKLYSNYSNIKFHRIEVYGGSRKDFSIDI